MTRQVAIAIACVVLVGCTATSKSLEPNTSSGAREAMAANAPKLLSPKANATIQQNNSQIGCQFVRNYGYGFQVAFNWTDDRSPGVVGYEILSAHIGSSIPAVDATVVPSEFRWRACNSFVADPNLTAWYWEVRSIFADGSLGPWSETRAYSFLPCRLTGGLPCIAVLAP
jgi:hypothetical protein